MFGCELGLYTAPGDGKVDGGCATGALVGCGIASQLVA